MRYLYPRQRQIEVIGAFYALGMGSYIGLSAVIHGTPPIGWLGLPQTWQYVIAASLCNLAIVWALGIKINGRWWLSPFLRLFAMVGFFGFAVLATVKGNGSSATYTYGWITFFLALGAKNAALDCLKSCQRKGMKWAKLA